MGSKLTPGTLSKVNIAYRGNDRSRLLSNVLQINACEMTSDDMISWFADVKNQALMVGCRQRTSAYKDAIMEQAAMIKGKTVMDMGAGSGILSLFCAQAGAAKV